MLFRSTRPWTFTLAVLLTSLLALSLSAGAGTQVPGHEAKSDQDGNGIPDAGVYVNGHYTSIYAEDASGAYYWDLGDGRIYSSPGIDSIEDLDQATLTVYDYVVNYRADFGNTPYMDNGRIHNHIRGSGYGGKSHYNYLIVSQTDPRYTGDPDWAVWGTWEYKVLTVNGLGNVVKNGRDG